MAGQAWARPGASATIKCHRCGGRFGPIAYAKIQLCAKCRFETRNDPACPACGFRYGHWDECKNKTQKPSNPDLNTTRNQAGID